MEATCVRVRRGRSASRRFAATCVALLVLIARPVRGDIAGFTQSGSGSTDYTFKDFKFPASVGDPAIASGTLRLNGVVDHESTSAFYNTTQDITNFTASFIYDMGQFAGNPGDGFAFVIHNDPRGLGARSNSTGSSGYRGFANSIATQYFIDKPFNFPATRTGAGHDGIEGIVSAFVDTAPVDLQNNPIRVDLAYRDGVITQVLTDTVTAATSRQTFFRTIPLYVGGTTALVGFTGGTSQNRAEQFVSNFSYTVGNAPVPSPPPAAQVIAGVPGGGIGFMGVREVTGAGNITTLALAQAAVTGSPGTRKDYVASQINLLDTGDAGHFTAPFDPDNAYRSNNADVGGADNVNQIAVIASGMVRITTESPYTFAVSSDDGFRLTIGGRHFEGASNASVNTGGALEFTSSRTAQLVSMGIVVLPAGDYPIQLLSWSSAGDASVELSVAAGIHDTFDSSFNLVGAPQRTLRRHAGALFSAGFEVVGFNNNVGNTFDGTALNIAIDSYNAYLNGTRTPDARMNAPTVFFSDPEFRAGFSRNNQADFGADRPFPVDTPADDDHFATGARGQLTVTAAGVYTFDVLSDDQFRFRIIDALGNSVNLIGSSSNSMGVNTDSDPANDAFRSTLCCTDRFGYYDLAVGEYTLEVIAEENEGGSTLALFGAYGRYDYFDPAVFQLVGQNLDTASIRPAGLELVPEPSGLLGVMLLCLLARRRRMGHGARVRRTWTY